MKIPLVFIIVTHAHVPTCLRYLLHTQRAQDEEIF